LLITTENYILDDDDWKHDKVPEVFDGKNVYDFIDPDIEAKLAALEEEEERLEAEGFYKSDDTSEDEEDADIRAKAELIREKRKLIQNAAKMKKSLKNRAIIPRTATTKKLSDMKSHLNSLGLNTASTSARTRSQSRGRRIVPRHSNRDVDAMDVDYSIDSQPEVLLRAKSRARSQSNRREDGITAMAIRSKAEKLAKLGQKRMNRMARQGEADRHTTSALPKHLVSILFCFHY
jgi:nucleolar GTP-binding protein